MTKKANVYVSEANAVS